MKLIFEMYKKNVKSFKKNLEQHQVSMANFVDLNEINKKVIEGNLPGSLLWDPGSLLYFFGNPNEPL